MIVLGPREFCEHMSRLISGREPDDPRGCIRNAPTLHADNPSITLMTPTTHAMPSLFIFAPATSLPVVSHEGKARRAQGARAFIPSRQSLRLLLLLLPDETVR